MKTMSRIWRRSRLAAARLLKDCRGIAATEFAVIVPVMLVMFFGTVEFSTGVAVFRKVTLVARTLSDLTGQAQPDAQPQTSATIDDTYLQNVFTSTIAMMQPYSPTPARATISEIYIDSSNVARIQWSKAATIGSGATQATLVTSSHNFGDVVTVPPTLVVGQTYVIFSEVSYLYTPAVGYVMGSAGVTLSDASYTRPRQAACVVYNSHPAGPPSCPTP